MDDSLLLIGLVVVSVTMPLLFVFLLALIDQMDLDRK